MRAVLDQDLRQLYLHAQLVKNNQKQTEPNGLISFRVFLVFA